MSITFRVTIDISMELWVSGWEILREVTCCGWRNTDIICRKNTTVTIIYGIIVCEAASAVHVVYYSEDQWFCITGRILRQSIIWKK